MVPLSGDRVGRAEGNDRVTEDPEYRRPDGHTGGAKWPGSLP